MNRLLSLSIVALTLPGLLAWKFLDPPRKFDEDLIPIGYVVGDRAPTGLTSAETLDLVDRAYAQWGDVPCSPLEFEFEGEVPNNEFGFAFADRNVTTFDDGGNKDDLGSGPLAATRTYTNDRVIPYNGVGFLEIAAHNVVFNEGIRWGTPEYVSSSSCYNTFDFLGVETHELGHGIGFGHSCEDGEACPDPLLRDATMFWSVADCDDGQRVPSEDDWGAVNGAYGISVDFEFAEVDGQSIAGAAPLTLTMSVPPEFQSNVTEYDWNFGDGSAHVVSSTPDDVAHTWGSEGQYTVTLSVTGQDAECGGEFHAASRKVGVVLACEPAAPSVAFANVGGFTVQMENTTDLGAFGCVTDFEWILDGDEEGSIRTYEPTYTFTEAGVHTVTLRASGPGSEDPQEVSVDIEVNKGADGAGCQSSVGSGGSVGVGALLLGLGLGLGVVRRRG